ncbi:unnamed protein product, partial [Staurois parvus]
AGAGPPDGATGLGPSGGAAGAGPPGGATGLGPSGGAAGAGPPGGATGLGPSGGAAGAGPPGGATGTLVTRHDSGLRVNWHDRWHWVRHWIVWLDSGHRVTRHQVIWLDSGHRVIWQGSGLRVNWYDRGHWSDIGSSDWTAGIGSPGIRSFGSTAGTASSGKAVGTGS